MLDGRKKNSCQTKYKANNVSHFLIYVLTSFIYRPILIFFSVHDCIGKNSKSLIYKCLKRKTNRLCKIINDKFIS